MGRHQHKMALESQAIDSGLLVETKKKKNKKNYSCGFPCREVLYTKLLGRLIWQP